MDGKSSKLLPHLVVVASATRVDAMSQHCEGLGVLTQR
ncbi:hypothetical protein EE612_029119 [Oryza sativa]|nr:hypothetical protein EE612_029119 [Oryza sativa]